MIAAWVSIAVALIIAIFTYAVNQARWQVKHDMWIRAIFRRLSLIEKHLGLGGGENNNDNSNGNGN